MAGKVEWSGVVMVLDRHGVVGEAGAWVAEAATEDHPQMGRPDLHEIRSGDLQRFEIIGEIGDVLLK
ncbi:MAG: hypothetical protein K0S10_1157 [Rubrobacteraceae bacterium]|nr:hypothetical protein [Rubrobacteraceae bacterium]